VKYFVSGSFKYGLVATLVLGGLALGAGGASAMPNGLAPALTAVPSSVENVGWVCGPYRCWGRPGWGPGPYGFYGPRPRPWGWGWHHWRRW
jgi:hypothetical protein